jgi:hypothetical protein
MLAMMVIAQITVLSGAPRPSSEDAAQMLRTMRSPANQTDAVFIGAPGVPTSGVPERWRPNDGPFGSFDIRLSQSSLAQRSHRPWIPVRSPILQFPRSQSHAIRPSRQMSTGGRVAFRPIVPRADRVRLTFSPRPTLTRSRSH